MFFSPASDRPKYRTLPARTRSADRARHVLDGNMRIDPVLVQQVDVVCLRAPQERLDCTADVVRTAVGARDFAVFDAKAELGGDHRLLAAALERPADQFFVAKRAVDFRGVEKIQPQFERAVNGGDRLGVVGNAI